MYPPPRSARARRECEKRSTKCGPVLPVTQGPQRSPAVSAVSSAIEIIDNPFGNAADLVFRLRVMTCNCHRKERDHDGARLRINQSDVIRYICAITGLVRDWYAQEVRNPPLTKLLPQQYVLHLQRSFRRHSGSPLDRLQKVSNFLWRCTPGPV